MVNTRSGASSTALQGSPAASTPSNASAIAPAPTALLTNPVVAPVTAPDQAPLGTSVVAPIATHDHGQAPLVSPASTGSGPANPGFASSSSSSSSGSGPASPAPLSSQMLSVLQGLLAQTREGTASQMLSANMQASHLLQLSASPGAPTFSGSAGADPRAFLRSFARLYRSNNVRDDALLLRALYNHLTSEPARDVYAQLKAAHPDCTWAQFSSAFITYYDSRQGDGGLRSSADKVATAKQLATQTLNEYHTHFMTLLATNSAIREKLNIAPLALPDQMRCFSDGLLPHLRRIFIKRCNITDSWESVLAVLRRAECAHITLQGSGLAPAAHTSVHFSDRKHPVQPSATTALSPLTSQIAQMQAALTTQIAALQTPPPAVIAPAAPLAALQHAVHPERQGHRPRSPRPPAAPGSPAPSGTDSLLPAGLLPSFCMLCRSPNHATSECPKCCSACGQGHPAVSCPHPHPHLTLRCTFCQRTGHKARVCMRRILGSIVVPRARENRRGPARRASDRRTPPSRPARTDRRDRPYPAPRNRHDERRSDRKDARHPDRTRRSRR